MQIETSTFGKTVSGEVEEEDRMCYEDEKEGSDCSEDAPLVKKNGSRAGSKKTMTKEDVDASRDQESKSKSLLKTLVAVGSWFFFNISMGSMTKWMYLYGKICHVDGTGCITYKFPFALTAVHMCVSWLVCGAIIWGRPVAQGKLGLHEQLRKIVPLALTFAASVGLGNMSLKYIYPSFNQMLASVSPLVTVVMSICLTGKRYNAWTWASMPIICGGLLACSSFEANYNTFGVFCVVAATVLRAAKSVMQERLLDPNEKASLDTIALLHHFCPWAMGFLVCMSVYFEGFEPISVLVPAPGKTGVTSLLLLLSLSGLTACFLNISGTYLTAYVGAVMLQILGNVKGCLAILVSALIFRNRVSPVQLFGVGLCLTGVWIYQRKGGAAKPAVPAVQPDANGKMNGKTNGDGSKESTSSERKHDDGRNAVRKVPH